MERARPEEVSRSLEDELRALTPELLERFPTDRYRALLDRYPRVASYRYLSRELSRLCDAIRSAGGEAALESYHRLLLARLIADAPERLRERELPDDVRQRLGRAFERIVGEVAADAEPGTYAYPSDKLFKDLCLCNLTLLPAGAQKVHLDRLPLRALVQSPGGALRGVAALGGIGPLWHMHTDSNDPDLMSEFSAEGWARFYRTTAALLRIQPRVRGVFGSSWFFDPEIERVSPRLGYLRALVTDHGGWLLRIGPSPQSTHDATLTSETRRKLHAEGRYQPTSYLLVWPRAPLLEWAA